MPISREEAEREVARLRKENDLLRRLDSDLTCLMDEWKSLGYVAHRFEQLLKGRGALGTVTYLLANEPKQGAGFFTLKNMGRLDLTVESMILRRTQYHELLNQNLIEKARIRLEKHKETH